MQGSVAHTREEIELMTKLFSDAEEMLKTGNDADAEIRYLTILECDPDNVYCLFRLGELFNRKKEPSRSLEYHLKALQTDARLAEKLTAKDHISHGYVYQETEEHINEACPLCGTKGVMHSCYNDMTNIDFIPGFHPIRIWMYCAGCEHIYARNYPLELGRVISDSQGSFHMKPNPNLLPVIGEVMNRIRGFAAGNKLLDIGVGAGEFAAVAKEFGFEVNGVEIRKAYADQVAKNLGIPVCNMDFTEYAPAEKYDVISMGDVIEHLTDPGSAIRKAHSLLNDNGILWISTPNFQSAYSRIMKDADPMWRVCEHLNYFSYRSLKKLLDGTGFATLDYSCSKHYSGSMEIIARRKTGCPRAAVTNDPYMPANAIRKLNLGCGSDIKSGWINLDIDAHDGVDVAADLDQCQTQPLPFPDDSFDEIYAAHMLESIQNPLPLMQELHRVCRPEAKAIFKLYYGSSDEATEGPAYARQYYLKSFGYFSQPYYWRADYGYRGDWLTEKITLFVESGKYKGKSESLILDDVSRKRNVVKEMIVEMKAIKPAREPRKELQAPGEIEISFV